MITLHALEKFFERVLMSNVDKKFLEENFYQSTQYMHSFFDKAVLVYNGYLHLNDKEPKKYYIYRDVLFVTSSKEAILTCYKINNLKEDEIASSIRLISDIGRLIKETETSLQRSKTTYFVYSDLSNRDSISMDILQNEMDNIQAKIEEDKLKLDCLNLIHRLFAKSTIMGRAIDHDYKGQIMGVYKHELNKLEMFDVLNSDKFAAMENYIINKL